MSLGNAASGGASLDASRWASSTHTPVSHAAGSTLHPQTGSINSNKNPSTQLNLAKRVLERLKWKADFLQLSHQRALSGQLDYAALMFKMDFFEYYQLMEKFIVCLLSSVNIEVSPTSLRVLDDSQHTSQQSTDRSSTAAQNSHLIGTRAYIQSSHSFHANVIDAISSPACPFRDQLGRGDAFHFIDKAKTFRNRWKDTERENPDVDALLYDMNIVNFCKVIIESFQAATAIADSHPAGDNDHVMTYQGSVNSNSVNSSSVNSDPTFVAVEDAMEIDIG